MRLKFRPMILHAGTVLRRIRLRRVHAAILAGLLGIYLLFGWLALPGILQSWAESYVLKRSGHHLTMDRPSFNPFTLALHIGHLRLAEPDGKLLLSFDGLVVDFSSSSLFHHAYVFDEIRLDNPKVSVTLLPKGRLNWSALVDAFQSGKKTSSGMPRLIVKRFTLSEGYVRLTDARTGAVTQTRLSPVNLKLTDLSTLPDDKGLYGLTARTDFGAQIRWDGQIALKPMLLQGTLRVDAVPLSWLAHYARLPAQLTTPQGVAALATHYRAGMIGNRFDFGLDHLSLTIDGFRVQANTDPDTALVIDHISVLGGRFELKSHQIYADRVVFSGGGIQTARSAAGRIGLSDLFAGPKASVSGPSAQSPQNTWQYRVAHVAINGFSANFRDKMVRTPADFSLQDIAVTADGISNNMQTPLPVHIAVRSRDGGTFQAMGTFTPATHAADFQMKLDGLVITPVQPYVAQLTTLKLKNGAISAQGHAVYDGKAGQYSGALSVQDLNIVEADGRQVFLGWKSLGTSTLIASAAGISVRELLLDGLDTRLIIAKDKTINLTQVLRKKTEPAPAETPASSGTKMPVPVRIDRLKISHSQLEFADHSLVLPFGTHIHALSGTIVNITSYQASAPARLQLQGQIDDYGMARAAGRVDLFKPTDLLNINVDFSNVEMTRLTPYSATFAGRRIDSGKLTLNLEYKINKRQLSGNNRIRMDQLTLGERVKSPAAHDLPLDLAIAILEDSHGRIDLGLPVSGSLDDPKFSYRAIIWKAITNVLTKIATAPFRALSSLFGGDDQFDGITFEAGQSALTPPEREKLVRFAEALVQRPGLSVAVHGTWSEADRVALKDLQLRKALAMRMGLSGAGDPGLLTPDQPQVQGALEGLYASRFGNGALAGVKQAFRKANPGQLPQSTGGEVISVLTGLLGTKPSYTDPEIAAMKGAHFHALLYQKLRDTEVVPDTELLGLAAARSGAVLSGLGGAKAPMGRIALRPAEKVDAADKAVPLKIDIGAAAAQ